MREAPDLISDPEVLSAVRAHWDPRVDRVTHLPVGFGAHHWRADIGPRPALFVTWDQLGHGHTLTTLDSTYRAAATLAARGLGFVHPCHPDMDGTYAVPLGVGALSVAGWLDGEALPGQLSPAQAEATLAMLARLHYETPPAGLRPWRPVVGPGLAEHLADRVGRPWDTGPFGERARVAVRHALGDIAHWNGDYLRLADTTDPAGWVTTHGEPHGANQVATVHGTVLVDWESMMLAPPERDLWHLAALGVPIGDPALITMFDHEWRLDEISQYAARFAAPHLGSASDQVALAGLLHELRRSVWTPARPDPRPDP